MKRALRVVTAVPLLTGLVFAGAFAVESGAAGLVTHDASRAINEWAMARAQPSLTDVRSLELRLQEVLARSASNPAAHELAGALAGLQAGRRESLARAHAHYLEALRLRPTSPYTWANLAGAKFRLGDTGSGFESALVHAVELGPHEAEVQNLVAQFGLAVWDQAGPGTRQAVERAVASGMSRDPTAMMRIALMRDRLEIACRHLAASQRTTDPKWVGTCQSMEVTQ